MRNSSFARGQPLFPRIRQAILTATLTQPKRWWYLTELAEFLRVRASSLQRELSSLVAGGILQRRREGTRVYFKAEARSPIFPELRRLLERTSGLVPTLPLALWQPLLGRMESAFVYGSIARKEESALLQ